MLSAGKSVLCVADGGRGMLHPGMLMQDLVLHGGWPSTPDLNPHAHAECSHCIPCRATMCHDTLAGYVHACNCLFTRMSGTNPRCGCNSLPLHACFSNTFQCVAKPVWYRLGQVRLHCSESSIHDRRVQTLVCAANTGAAECKTQCGRSRQAESCDGQEFLSIVLHP